MAALTSYRFIYLKIQNQKFFVCSLNVLIYSAIVDIKETLGDYREKRLDLRITCRWCGTIRLMPIDQAIEAARTKRGGAFTHVTAFAEEVKCSKCGFKKATIEPEDGEVSGRTKAAPVELLSV